MFKHSHVQTNNILDLYFIFLIRLTLTEKKIATVRKQSCCKRNICFSIHKAPGKKNIKNSVDIIQLKKKSLSSRKHFSAPILFHY